MYIVLSYFGQLHVCLDGNLNVIYFYSKTEAEEYGNSLNFQLTKVVKIS